MEHLLKDLNPRQHEAVVTTEGPLLVIAGAGSGKTRVLTRRLAYMLVQRLAEPFQLLAVTFTNKAAGEMKERVNQLMGAELSDLNVSTFHSYCARFLRREAAAIGYDPSFTIFDDGDSISLVKRCTKELGISDGQFPARGQLRKISDAKNALVTAEQFASKASGYFESRTAELYTLYQRRLRECNAMDFDDLLFNAVWALMHDASVREKYQRRYRYLLVDEYQDTNHVQYLLLKYLLGDHHNLCVVGDEDQSIYGWRGADIRNILEFEEDYPGAKLIKLEQNYRSTACILQAASAVIKKNSARKEKELWTESTGGDKLELILVNSAEDEADRVVKQIANNRSASPLKESVILYRTNSQSRAFEEHLRRDNLPYQIVGGVLFYQRKEIKDLMAYLKLIANPKDDISFERVINYPKRGIGEKSISDIAALARARGRSMLELCADGATYPELFGKIKRIEPFTKLIAAYRERAAHDPVDLIVSDLVTEIKLLEELVEEDKVLGQTKVENVEAFVEGVAEYARTHPEPRLAEYLSEISLFTDLDNYRDIDDKVTLMTLHSAKGLEFDTVYLVGLEEGLFPLQRTIHEPMQLEEERRLFYVGATRARRRLVLTSATSRFRFGEVEAIPSRFLKEIPPELVDVNDYRSRVSARQSAGAYARPTSGTYPSGAADAGAEVRYVYEENETYRVGRTVMHPTFGRGRILGAEGLGESLRLEIMFGGIGVKRIMAKYAKLKVVG